jgi:hypothetical protein
MATFNEEVEIEISPREYLASISEDEKKELVQLLTKKNFFKSTNPKTFKEKMFLEALEKLFNNRHRLSLEQEDYIVNLSNEF